MIGRAIIGISLINPSAPTGQQAGSTYILDSLFDGTATAIKANFEQASILETTGSIITLDNIGVLNVNTIVTYTDGDNLDLAAADVDFVIIGNLEADGSAYGQYSVAVQLPAPSRLGPTSSYYRDSYFVQSRLQYTDIAVGSIISVKVHGAVSNSVHDDTAAIVSALAHRHHKQPDLLPGWILRRYFDDCCSTKYLYDRRSLVSARCIWTLFWRHDKSQAYDSILYQYNFANTTNTFAGMIQTESPYYQYTTATESPGPFSSSIGLFAHDPAFPNITCDASALLCDFSWAVMLAENVNLTIAGAGLYSWFKNYIETCVDSQNCQQRLINDAGDNEALYLWNLVTISAVEIVSNTYTANAVLAKNNTKSIGHPYWSALARYLDDNESEIRSCAWNDTGPGCDETLLCDLTLTFETFANLQAAQGIFFWTNAQITTQSILFRLC